MRYLDIESHGQYLTDRNFHEQTRFAEKVKEERIKQLIHKFPWIFFLHFSIGERCKIKGVNRGSNYWEYQLGGITLTIGRPWKDSRLREVLDLYGDLHLLRQCNQANLQSFRTALMIGTYQTL